MQSTPIGGHSAPMHSPQRGPASVASFATGPGGYAPSAYSYGAGSNYLNPALRNPFVQGGGLATFAGTLPYSTRGQASTGAAGLSWLLKYLRRGLSIQQLDIEYVAYQLIYACRSPAKVYKLTQLRKQTKNQWARDDPSFVFVLAALIGMGSISWAVAYGVWSPITFAWLACTSILQMVFVNAIVATATWAIANRHLRVAVPLPHSVEQSVEWLFAWDVACNATVPTFLCLSVLQLLLLPLVLGSGWLSLLLANALYAIAGVLYWYNIFSGYLGEWQHERVSMQSQGTEVDVRGHMPLLTDSIRDDRRGLVVLSLAYIIV